VTNKRSWPFVGLSKEAFTVTDDKKPREITSFSHEDVPQSVGVILDMSGSMGGKKSARYAVQFFEDFLKASNQTNVYFIMGFATRPAIVVDWTTDITGILSRLVPRAPSGQTALYDALYLGVEKVKTGKYNRRALILITDGPDNSSKHTFSEVRESLRESDVVLYTVALLSETDRDSGSPLATEADSVLSELSSATGGKVFYVEKKEHIKEAFEILAAEIRNQYRIGFRPSPGDAKSKLRSIKVKVTPPQNASPEFRNLVVRSREGYYPNKIPR